MKKIMNNIKKFYRSHQDYAHNNSNLAIFKDFLKFSAVFVPVLIILILSPLLNMLGASVVIIAMIITFFIEYFIPIIWKRFIK